MTLRVLDFFSGAGGFSLGFELEGIKVDTHIEIDQYASETIKKNFPESKTLTEDIRFIDPSSLTDDGDIDVIIGGPPCQGFSVAGSTQFGIDDDRNELVFWYLHFIEKISPKIVIIENVPNVLNKKSKDGHSFLDLVTKIAQEIGYEVSYNILNSLNYGVPQSRRRAFIVLHLKGTKFHFPEITHGGASDNQFSLFPLKSPVTVGEALDDLPLVDVGGIGSGLPYITPPNNNYQKYCRGKSLVVTNHDPMQHTNRVIERFKIIKQGQSLKDVPLSHGQVAYGTGEKVSKPFKYNNYRLDANKPSLAIPASYQSLFVHPTLNRNLTAREGARLMSFPDWYEFKGPKTMMSWESGLSQYNQIGNAVCPLVSRAIAKSVKDYLNSMTGCLVNTNQSKTLLSIYKKLKKDRYEIKNARQGRLLFLSNLQRLEIDGYHDSKFYDFDRKIFRVNNVDVELESVVYAYQLLRTENCPICNPNDMPRGNHFKLMNLLISKSDLKSLLSKGRDNGLDFHLRILTESDRRIANEVALILEDLGMVNIVTAQNPRTGKKVKSVSLISRKETQEQKESLKDRVDIN